VRHRILAVCLLLGPTAGHADGPALAHVTLDGQTLTLTAQNAPFQPPMIRPEGRALHLTFADLHLGFPLPPTLALSLLQGPETWSVTALRFDTADATYLSNFAQIIEINDLYPDDLSLTLTAEVLAPAPPLGTSLVRIVVEIRLRSP